jgi:hypothetical protein
MKTSELTGGPAFPTPQIVVNEQGQITGFAVDADGMTLRDYFAAKAMQSIRETAPATTYEHIAKYAYEMADAMLKARET